MGLFFWQRERKGVNSIKRANGTNLKGAKWCDGNKLSVCYLVPQLLDVLVDAGN